MKKAGISVTFQWPKESLDFVEGVREKVENLGYERKTYFARIRPTVVEGTVYIRADVKRKDGGKFEKLAYWRIPPRDRARWGRITDIMEPEWLVRKTR